MIAPFENGNIALVFNSIQSEGVRFGFFDPAKHFVWTRFWPDCPPVNGVALEVLSKE